MQNISFTLERNRLKMIIFYSETFTVYYFVGYKAKERISERVFQEKNARQIFRKIKISYPLISTRTCAYQGVRNVNFSENLACFVFLKQPFWDSSFCLITDDFVHSNVFLLSTKRPSWTIMSSPYIK